MSWDIAATLVEQWSKPIGTALKAIILTGENNFPRKDRESVPLFSDHSPDLRHNVSPLWPNRLIP